MNSFKLGGKTLRNEPAPKVERWFLKALKRLGGCTDYGDDFLRLVWGMEETVSAYGEQRMKYLAASAVVKTGSRINVATAEIEPILERVDIGRARWFVEEWKPPELIAPDYDEEILGKFPANGKWYHFLTLETPDGRYRHPDRECLQWIEQCWQERQMRLLLHDKGEREHPFHFAQRMRDAQYEMDQLQERKEAQLHDRYRSLLAPHIHRLTKTNPREGYDSNKYKRREDPDGSKSECNAPDSWISVSADSNDNGN